MSVERDRPDTYLWDGGSRDEIPDRQPPGWLPLFPQTDTVFLPQWPLTILLNLIRGLPAEPQWQDEWPRFTFLPVVGDDEDNDWAGHHDQLVRAVLASGMDWKNVEVHASGSPTMVYTLMDALVDAGLPEEAFYSDVLEYAPRS